MYIIISHCSLECMLCWDGLNYTVSPSEGEKNTIIVASDWGQNEEFAY